MDIGTYLRDCGNFLCSAILTRKRDAENLCLQHDWATGVQQWRYPGLQAM